MENPEVMSLPSVGGGSDAWDGAMLVSSQRPLESGPLNESES